MMAMRVQIKSASSNRWVVRMMDRPPRAALMTSASARRDTGSTPVDGSSRNMVLEPPSSATHRDSLRLLPPLYSLVCWSLYLVRSSLASAASTRPGTMSGFRPLMRA